MQINITGILNFCEGLTQWPWASKKNQDCDHIFNSSLKFKLELTMRSVPLLHVRQQ